MSYTGEVRLPPTVAYPRVGGKILVDVRDVNISDMRVMVGR